MNSIAPAPRHIGDDEAFPSAAALRTAHSGLLRRERIERDQQAFRDEVLAFVQHGRLTGKILDDPAERRAVQSVLDYWATVVYRGDGEIIDSTLDEFDPDLAPYIPEESCPYLGLESFGETQHALFFGRRRMVDEYLSYLASHRMLAVVVRQALANPRWCWAAFVPNCRRARSPAAPAGGMCRAWCPAKIPCGILLKACSHFC